MLLKQFCEGRLTHLLEELSTTQTTAFVEACISCKNRKDVAITRQRIFTIGGEFKDYVKENYQEKCMGTVVAFARTAR